MKLKRMKVAVLNGSRRMGLLSVVGRTPWRTRRLLVLAYHGISQRDEHLWNPALYMSQDAFRRRLELLSRNRCSVLPLGEAVSRLQSNDLPPRAVALTFDDGCYDFFTRAYPVIKDWGFPVTVYQTSYYSAFNRPVFDVACSYVLWMAAGRRAPGLDLRSDEKRTATLTRLLRTAYHDGMSADEKDALLDTLAASLQVDVGPMRANRTLHLMKPEELRQLIRDGVDVQLHTHRHRMPAQHDDFVREIADNRAFLRALGQLATEHFCYPDGKHGDRYLPWLAEMGVRTATTCVSSLATSTSPKLLLPRIVDSSSLSDVEFEGWLHGVSQVLPRRREVSKSLPSDLGAWGS